MAETIRQGLPVIRVQGINPALVITEQNGDTVTIRDDLEINTVENPAVSLGGILSFGFVNVTHIEITHNLGRIPIIQLVAEIDGAETLIEGAITLPQLSTVAHVDFLTPMTGTAWVR